MCAVYSVLLVLLTVTCCHSSKVLMIAAQQVSHVMEQVAVGEDLITRGHSVHMLLQDTFPKLDSVRDVGIHPVVYPQGMQAGMTVLLDKIQIECFNKDFQPLKAASGMMDVLKLECSNLLYNTELMDRLRDEDYDLAMVDGFMFSHCLFLIPYNLTIPYVFMSATGAELAYGIPNIPSMSVSVMSTNTPCMSLWQRFASAFEQCFLCFLLYTSDTPSLVEEFAPSQSSTLEVVRKSSLFIYPRDHVLEWPYVSLPNVIRVPGITVREGQPLSGDVSDVVEGAGFGGVILLSFGSSVDSVPKDIFQKFMHAFGNITNTVIFRVSKELVANPGIPVPANVHLLSWLPQQDILAHPNTKLFITHCGNNGQYEAVYHGVPMIGFPLFAEQHHNCMRMEDKGVGKCLSVHTFTPGLLTAHINTVIGDRGFTERAQKLGAIIRSSAPPAEIIVDSLEHVMEFGGEHLRSVAHYMPLYQLLMADVYGLVVVGVIVLVLAVKYLLISIIYRCTGRHSTKSKLE